jgi:hypothetical protein
MKDRFEYREGDTVEFDSGDGSCKGKGIICGKSISNIVDVWII